MVNNHKYCGKYLQYVAAKTFYIYFHLKDSPFIAIKGTAEQCLFGGEALT